YYMIFASPHPDSMLLFNDGMCKAFNKYMLTEETKDTLFADVPWTEWRDTKELTDIVVEYTRKYPSKTRKELWTFIVQDYFMRFTEPEYRQSVTNAIDNGRIFCSTPIKSKARPTKSLNDNCVLEPVI